MIYKYYWESGLKVWHGKTQRLRNCNFFSQVVWCDGRRFLHKLGPQFNHLKLYILYFPNFPVFLPFFTYLGRSKWTGEDCKIYTLHFCSFQCNLFCFCLFQLEYPLVLCSKRAGFFLLMLLMVKVLLDSGTLAIFYNSIDSIW